MNRADRDLALVLDIVLACRDVGSFVAGTGRADFLEVEAASDVRKTRAAVIHQLPVIGEATKRLSEGYRATNTDVPWRAMAGLRDRLIHGYDEVDLARVRQIATVEVPAVLSRLEPRLPADPAAD